LILLCLPVPFELAVTGGPVDPRTHDFFLRREPHSPQTSDQKGATSRVAPQSRSDDVP